MKNKNINTQILDNLIIGRVEPHIYAFSTNTIPNYLKIGDTYRPVKIRLKEWENKYPNLIKQFEDSAKINNDIYFRDYSVHQYLEKDLGKKRLKEKDLQSNTYFSKEFFYDTKISNVIDAITDIKNNYNRTNKYDYYSASNNLPQTFHYKRGDNWILRPNQREAVDNFLKAINNKRTNLLMYAVMRFGKSFTSLCCALEMGAKLILIVSAKADVKDEWKLTVEGAGNFKKFVFLDSKDLNSNENAIKEEINNGNIVTIFLTLQDLQGKEIKEKHKEIFNSDIDLLIVDETHFGARAESYGAVLKNKKQELKNLNNLEDESIDQTEASIQLKKLNSKIKLHLSGTPYRILMGSEFEKEDLISFVQFSDIVKEQEKWDLENLHKDDENEWNNPYFGFPQMIRFAFNPNKSSIRKMEQLKKDGVTFALSALFEPLSIKKDKQTNKHKKFKNEKEILDLLQIIDGSKNDENIIGFLDYDKIKKGNMCRHIVIVLPYCASCDAMEKLINNNKNLFKNLRNYEIINISGVDSASNFKKSSTIKRVISKFETENKKTITLTVNRLLTGSTVKEWDTMLYLKDTVSPQEYDQAIFRLQNQYTRTLYNGERIIKENMKPQTILVDFDPNRLFRMQEQKSLIYNVNTEKNGNTRLIERITEELRISPIIMINHNKIRRVEAINILEAISEYNNQKSISDEVIEIPIDLTILKDENIKFEIERQSEFSSKNGFTLKPIEGDGEDFEFEGKNNKPNTEGKYNSSNSSNKDESNNDNTKRYKQKIQTYYQRMLFYAFLCNTHVKSLDDIIETINNKENLRLSKNLSLNKKILSKMSIIMEPFIRSRLDYKIQNISNLAYDQKLPPIERALTSLKKFNRMSESEIITPVNIAKEMVDLISENSIQKIVANNMGFLDIASKSGEYALVICQKVISEFGYSIEEIKDKIYSIPTSSIAYEFTRKFYEILGLNINNIAINFNSYDLLNIKYEKIKNILCQNKKFNEIDLNKNTIGDTTMKFEAIVGNPPYHKKDGGAKASAKPIYQHFVDIGLSLKPRYISYIIPTRWFAGGKKLDEFRHQMLTNPHITEIHDFLSPEKIFPNTNNRGGVCYFLIDNNYNNNKNVRLVTHKSDGSTIESNRPLLKKGVEIFIRDSIGLNILNKIYGDNPIHGLNNIVSSRQPFGIESKYSKSKNFHKDKSSLTEPIICIGKGKTRGFIEKSIVTKHENWINLWKVFVPRANNIGTELNDDNLNAFIGRPGEICTEAYIVIGSELLNNEKESIYLSKYLHTKFVRYLHSLAKAGHDASSSTYRFIPIENFSKSSSIDWEKNLINIDEQLFNKYKLNNFEKDHIKNSIKDM